MDTPATLRMLLFIGVASAVDLLHCTKWDEDALDACSVHLYKTCSCISKGAKQILLLCCIEPDCKGISWYSLRTSYVMFWVDMVGNKASKVSARRTVAIVVGPLNVLDIAAFRGCIRSLKTFFAYVLMSPRDTCRRRGLKLWVENK